MTDVRLLSTLKCRVSRLLCSLTLKHLDFEVALDIMLERPGHCCAFPAAFPAGFHSFFINKGTGVDLNR